MAYEGLIILGIMVGLFLLGVVTTIISEHIPTLKELKIKRLEKKYEKLKHGN